jgi:hypothetical protein
MHLHSQGFYNLISMIAWASIHTNYVQPYNVFSSSVSKIVKQKYKQEKSKYREEHWFQKIRPKSRHGNWKVKALFWAFWPSTLHISHLVHWFQKIRPKSRLSRHDNWKVKALFWAFWLSTLHISHLVHK